MLSTLAFSVVTTGAVESTDSHWTLFLLYFLMNLIDLGTGVTKAVSRKEYNSSRFCKGVLGKVARWSIVAIAMITHYLLIDFGSVLGFDAGVTKVLVWFVLSALIFQDIRSVFENLKIMGVEVPPILVKILALAEQQLDTNDIFDGDMIVDSSNGKSSYRLELNDSFDALSEKDKITFKVKQADKTNLD